MKTIKRLFKEVRRETMKVAFLNSFLNATLAFFSLYLVMVFLDYSYLYSLIPALVFFIGDFIYWYRHLDLRAVEEANPEVKEILRTAHDHQGEKNVLVLGMFYDLVQKMKNVSAGNLLDSSALFKKTVAISLLTFAVVVLSSLEIYMGGFDLDLSDASSAVAGFSGGGSEAGQGNETLETIGFNKTRGLYGNESVARLGDEQLNLNINPSQNQMNFDEEKSLEEKQFKDKSYPSEANAEASDFGGNDVPDEAELAKEYNLELRR